MRTTRPRRCSPRASLCYGVSRHEITSVDLAQLDRVSSRPRRARVLSPLTSSTTSAVAECDSRVRKPIARAQPPSSATKTFSLARSLQQSLRPPSVANARAEGNAQLPQRVTPAPAATATAAPADVMHRVRSGSDDAASGRSLIPGRRYRVADRSDLSGHISPPDRPGESFVDSSARILSVHAGRHRPRHLQSRLPTSRTSTGEYYITFTLTPGPGGLLINEHFAIKTGP